MARTSKGLPVEKKEAALYEIDLGLAKSNGAYIDNTSAHTLVASPQFYAISKRIDVKSRGLREKWGMALVCAHWSYRLIGQVT